MKEPPSNWSGGRALTDLPAWLAGLVAAAAGGYFIGSVPVGYLLGRWLGVDPRAHGSGKMGATNVLRTMGPKASAVVMLCDLAKGAAAVALARVAFDGLAGAEVAAGLAAIIGHVFPVFAGFRGGRGVATSLGAMLIISPAVGLAALLAGSVVIAWSKMASLGSLLGALLALVLIGGLVAVQQAPPPPLVYCLVAFVILALSHRDNIQRLLAGTERKIELKS